MIVGVDVGYTYTKFISQNKRGFFKSTVQEGKIDINNSLVLEYKGQEYTIGEKGAYSIDFNKINDLTFKLCLYTAIAQVMQKGIDIINLVTGLPIGYYSSQKHTLKEKLKGTDVFIKHNKDTKIFTIHNCIVFPQSAGLIATQPYRFKGDNLIIDIGGLTVDISYFEEMKLIKYATYPLGMLKLYGKIAQEFIKREIDYDVLDVERKMKAGLEYWPESKIIPIDEIIAAHTQEILRRIKLDFPYKTSQKTYIGGGSIALSRYLGAQVRESDIYTNAEAFYKIGVEKFDR